jgi:hypothetical protein
MSQKVAFNAGMVAFDSLDDLRGRLREHELSGRLTTHRNITVFMKHHIWAVWDFMSLVKVLQNRLTY